MIYPISFSKKKCKKSDILGFYIDYLYIISNLLGLLFFHSFLFHFGFLKHFYKYIKNKK